MRRFGGHPQTRLTAVRAAVSCALLALLQSACGPAGASLAPTTVIPQISSAQLAAGSEPAPSRELSAAQATCSGAEIHVEEFTKSDSILGASLAFEVPNTSAGVSLDWVGPYLDLDPRPASPSLPFLELVVMEWTTIQRAGVTRHLVKIGWPPFREVVLNVRAAAARCESSITCSADGCEVTS